MNGYLVFDTETSGLFRFKDADGKPVPADAPGQPRLASFAGIITDAAGNALERRHFYVRPDGWSMDPKATEVNGLTDLFLKQAGVPVAAVLDWYQECIGSGLVIAAFNAQFDCKVMRAELRRAGRPDLFEETPNTCLMRGAATHLGKGRYVSLTAACDAFGIVLDHAHDAEADAEAARAIMAHLIRAGALIPPKVHYARAAP